MEGFFELDVPELRQRRIDDLPNVELLEANLVLELLHSTETVDILALGFMEGLHTHHKQGLLHLVLEDGDVVEYTVDIISLVNIEVYKGIYFPPDKD